MRQRRWTRWSAAIRPRQSVQSSPRRATANVQPAPPCRIRWRPKCSLRSGDRAGATVFAQAAERVRRSFQSAAWTAMAGPPAVRWRLTDADAGRARERFLSALAFTKGPISPSGPPAAACRPEWPAPVRLTGTRWTTRPLRRATRRATGARRRASGNLIADPSWPPQGTHGVRLREF